MSSFSSESSERETTTETPEEVQRLRSRRKEKESKRKVSFDEDESPVEEQDKPTKDKKLTSGWCIPFIIYIVISAIVILGFILSRRSVGETITYVLIQLVWVVLFGLIIYWLCKSGKTGWAWFVLFLPLIIQITWVVLVAVL